MIFYVFAVVLLSGYVLSLSSKELIAAYNAALTRAIKNEVLTKLTNKYPGVAYVELLTCSSDFVVHPFPQKENSGLLGKVINNKLLIVGSIDKVSQEGNYTKSKSSGFMIDLLDEIVKELNVNYFKNSEDGIKINRKFYDDEQAVLKALDLEEIDMTEPDYIYASADEVSRLNKYIPSCTILSFNTYFGLNSFLYLDTKSIFDLLDLVSNRISKNEVIKILVNRTEDFTYVMPYFPKYDKYELLYAPYEEIDNIINDRVDILFCILKDLSFETPLTILNTDLALPRTAFFTMKGVDGVESLYLNIMIIISVLLI